MVSVASVSVPTEAFPLGQVFVDHPGVQVELERVVPTGETIVPYFWVRDVREAGESLDATLADHPDVVGVEIVDSSGVGQLLRVEWNADVQGLLKAVTAPDVTVLSGRGCARNWSFELRAEHRDAFASFQHYCREHDVPIELLAIHDASTPSDDSFGLTDCQREALVLAFQRGYFDSRRRVTLGELGDALDISRQAVASRLRRGHRQLIRRTLLDP